MDNGSDKEEALPPSLRLLKTLVTVLTATMIIGLVTIITLLVIRLNSGIESSLPLPEEIVLPEGAEVLSVTYGPDHYIVVTKDNRVLIFNVSGELTKTIEIE